MYSCITFSWNVHNHTFSDTGRNFYFHNLFTFYDPSTMTLLTFVLNNGSFALTSRTDTLSLHHSKETLSRMCDNASTMTCLTSFRSTSCSSTRTMTMVTRHILFNFKFFSNP